MIFNIKKYFDVSFDVTRSFQQIEIPNIFYICALCSELQSNLSTMVDIMSWVLFFSRPVTKMGGGGVRAYPLRK